MPTLPETANFPADPRRNGFPTAISLPGLPTAVTIYEVSPRDGLQNETRSVPTNVKTELIHRLADAGLTCIEATSFVRPQWIPQLADAGKLMSSLSRKPGIKYPVLVPNEQGLQQAIQHGVTDIAIFASATESFSQRNLNRSIDQALAMFAPVVEQARALGMWVRGYLSMCFGDPWEGQVSVPEVVHRGQQLLDLGCDEISLGDTIGVATPGHTAQLIQSFIAAGVPTDQLAVHFHDTYGQALSNALTALQCGVTTVDSSTGGIGGCPYAESATGNLATEDLVWMLDGLGIATGVDLTKLLATSQWMSKQLGHPSPSRVVQAFS